MPTYLAAFDLSGSELRNAVIQNLGTDPSSPAAGQIWYNSTGGGVLKYRNGSTTISLASGSDVVSKATYDANTILKADTDDTPIALTVGASTILGRGAAGGIDALTPSAARTVLGLGSLATLSTITSSEITDGTITNGDINASAGVALSKLATQANNTILGNNSGSSGVPLALTGAQTMAVLSGTATATFSFNSQTVSGIGTPSAGTDAANKAYVDGVAQGLDIKASVRVASTATVTLATPGAAIDGVTLTNGDRVLLMNQSAAAENGIWVFNGAASAMTRATDADTSAEVNSGMFVFVEEGVANADKGFALTTNNPITLGSTGLTFSQFSGSGTVTGTSNRITVTGNQVDISSSYVGQASLTTLGTIGTGTWQATAIATTYGGTGSTTVAGAKTNLGFVGRYATTFGNGALTTFTITHNLGTNDVAVEIYDATSNATVYANVTRATTNTLTIDGFTTAPANNGLRVVVIG